MHGQISRRHSQFLHSNLHSSTMFSRAQTTLVASVLLGVSSVSALTWGSTKFLFVFGDSYTTTGWNISAGINSPVPGFTSSNGQNWVQYLG